MLFAMKCNENILTRSINYISCEAFNFIYRTWQTLNVCYILIWFVWCWPWHWSEWFSSFYFSLCFGNKIFLFALKNTFFTSSSVICLLTRLFCFNFAWTKCNCHGIILARFIRLMAKTKTKVSKKIHFVDTGDSIGSLFLFFTHSTFTRMNGFRW